MNQSSCWCWGGQPFKNKSYIYFIKNIKLCMWKNVLGFKEKCLLLWLPFTIAFPNHHACWLIVFTDYILSTNHLHLNEECDVCQISCDPVRSSPPRAQRQPLTKTLLGASTELAPPAPARRPVRMLNIKSKHITYLIHNIPYAHSSAKLPFIMSSLSSCHHDIVSSRHQVTLHLFSSCHERTN